VYSLNLHCMLEFYTTLLVYLYFLASQWFHTFKSFSNLHFLGLPFFYIRDVFGIVDLTVILCNTKLSVFYCSSMTSKPNKSICETELARSDAHALLAHGALYPSRSWKNTVALKTLKNGLWPFSWSSTYKIRNLETPFRNF